MKVSVDQFSQNLCTPIKNQQSSIINPQGRAADISSFLEKNLGPEENCREI
jgi:hypothetical protein